MNQSQALKALNDEFELRLETDLLGIMGGRSAYNKDTALLVIGKMARMGWTRDAQLGTRDNEAVLLVRWYQLGIERPYEAMLKEFERIWRTGDYGTTERTLRPIG